MRKLKRINGVGVMMENYPEIRERIDSVIKKNGFKYILLNPLVEMSLMNKIFDLNEMGKTFSIAPKGIVFPVEVNKDSSNFLLPEGTAPAAYLKATGIVEEDKVWYDPWFFRYGEKTSCFQQIGFEVFMEPLKANLVVLEVVSGIIEELKALVKAKPIILIGLNLLLKDKDMNYVLDEQVKNNSITNYEAYLKPIEFKRDLKFVVKELKIRGFKKKSIEELLESIYSEILTLSKVFAKVLIQPIIPKTSTMYGSLTLEVRYILQDGRRSKAVIGGGDYSLGKNWEKVVSGSGAGIGVLRIAGIEMLSFFKNTLPKNKELLGDLEEAVIGG